MSTITPEAQEAVAQRRAAADKSAADAEQYRKDHPDGGDCEAEHFNMMPPEDELEWLRAQYMELRGMLDAARQGYADAGREAATLRRVLASRAPTVRERAAIAVLPYCVESFTSDVAAQRAVEMADKLMEALKGDANEP